LETVNGSPSGQRVVKRSYEQVGVAINTPVADVRVAFNNLQAATGVTNLGGGMVDASQNWWGCAHAAGASGCGSELGGVTATNAAPAPFQK
jgi:hypothetical protein